MTSALDGITVIDFTQFESGTVCTQTLAWLGAKVIKIERPKTGEQGRRSFTDPPGIDAYTFILVNSNKRSVTLDIKKPRGAELLRQLIAGADVLVENFAPGTLEQAGFGYEAVAAINSRIVYAQIKGFSPDSPYASHVAFDPVGQAMGGILSLTGEPDRPPLRTGPNLADSGTGFHTALGIVAALYQRTVTGRGQLVRLAMQEVMINYIRTAFAQQIEAGMATPRVGNNHTMARVAPCGIYPCKPFGPNDYVTLYASRWPGATQWEQLCDVIAHPEMKTDPRLATPESRYTYRAEIDANISAWTRERTKFEAMQELAAGGVPAGAILTTAELAADPYLNESGMFITVDHPVRGPVHMPGFPIHMSDSAVPIEPAPLLGQHNREIYQGMLGLSSEEMESLSRSRVI